ncbi:helix-turn-helix transcriptional regulator [Sulfitobacter noctilucicola]|uniref:helix-turn-helix domain-containing protein n=1 Tax=Sulfitobacter noctilucicola TaxID=1342301 RepID=UPI00288952BA|nr:helix-turn-helix transcriptional regulator [Sulfitobacter noctilucicola]
MKTATDFLLHHLSTTGAAHVSVQRHFELNHVTCCKKCRRLMRVSETVKVCKIAMIFAPKDCFLIIKITPKYYAHHTFYVPFPLSRFYWLLTFIFKVPCHGTCGFVSLQMRVCSYAASNLLLISVNYGVLSPLKMRKAFLANSVHEQRAHMAAANQSPAELRSMFGANLRLLSLPYSSISDLSRQLGINRTQYNRYLNGESFPRPDVLSRICTFFDVDARVLLEPVDQIASARNSNTSSYLKNYVYAGAEDVPTDIFPSGFYRFTRRSFTMEDVFISGLVYIFRKDSQTFLRGYETKKAMTLQDFPNSAEAREFRGAVMQQESGIVFIVSRKNAMTSSFNYISRVPSFENNFWVGYVTRTVPENQNGLRATRMVFEYVGKSTAVALRTARKSGFLSREELPTFHRRHLQPDLPFS